MFDFIYQSGITTKQNKTSIVTEALLLSPSVDKSVNSRYNRIVKKHYLNFWTKSIGQYNIYTPYWRCFYNVFYTYDELYYEDFTSATR